MIRPGVMRALTLEATTLRSLGGSIGASRSDRLASLSNIVLPDPGRCPARPTHQIFIFDDSGSVVGGNDPIGQRYEEAIFAMRAVARRCRCKKEIGSILHFDRGLPEGDAGPTLLNRTGLTELEDALNIPRNCPGISNLGPALSDARMLAMSHPGHMPVLTALTDFELFDSDVASVLDALCSFPGKVVAVSLRSAPPMQLVDDPRVQVVHVTEDSPHGSVALAVFEALTCHRTKVGRKKKPITSKMELAQ